MVQIYKKMMKLLDKKQKRTMIGLIFIMLIGAILEAASITVIFPAIQAIIAQSQYGVLQRVGNHYWGPCTTFIDTLVAGNPEGKSLQELLDNLVTDITASTVK